MKTKNLLFLLMMGTLSVNAQNVGIGTTTPSTNLDVNGTVRIRGGTPTAGKVLHSDANGLASWSQEGLVPASAIVFSETADNANLLANGFQYFGQIFNKVLDTTTFNSPVQTWVNSSEDINRSAPNVLAFPNNKFIVYNGLDAENFSSHTSIYDPVLDNWESYAEIPDTIYRQIPVVLMANGKLVVWGGYPYSDTFTNIGYIFDVATDTWTPMNNIGGPQGRFQCAYAYDSVSNSMAIWGGRTYSATTSTSTYYNSGYVYNFNTNAWSLMSTTGAPSARAQVGTASGGSRMFICGGFNGTTYFSTSYLYSFATNTWVSAPSYPSIGARKDYTCFYTGSKFLAWGGTDATYGYKTGALLNPATNTWISMSVTGSPLIQTNASTAFYNNNLYYAANINSAKYDVASNTWSAIENPLANQPSLAANSKCLFAFGEQFSYSAATAGLKGERFFYTATPIKNNYFINKALFLFRKN